MKLIEVRQNYAIDRMGSYYTVILFKKFWVEFYLADIKVVTKKYPLWYKVLRFIFKK